MQPDNVVHGFYLSLIRTDGGEPIFRFPVLPDHIINTVARTPSGSTITFRLLVSGKSDTCDVDESKEEIEMLISRCQTLDAQDPLATGALKDGKRIA